MNDSKQEVSRNSFIIRDESEGEQSAPSKMSAEREVNKDSPKSASSAVLKLLLITGIGYGAYTYGIPLVNQYADKLNEPAAEKIVEEGTIEKIHGSEAVSATQASSTRVTSGYEAWAPEVKKQLGQWLGAAPEAFIVSHISVHKSGEPMEIRYLLLDGEKQIKQAPLYLHKDGFGERFTYKNDGKEIIVYPPLEK